MDEGSQKDNLHTIWLSTRVIPRGESQLLYKEINYEYLKIFEQLLSWFQLFLCRTMCIVRY